jgi:hypothetical protein
VDPRVDLNDVEKKKFLTLPGLELRPLGRPVHGQSLYQLRYPGSFENEVVRIMCNENEVRELGEIIHNGETLHDL